MIYQEKLEESQNEKSNNEVGEAYRHVAVPDSIATGMGERIMSR